MNAFLSHARKDGVLARQLAERLALGGFAVWSPEDEIEPGENWAKKMGKALDNTELMVFLLTPRAMESDLLRHDIEFVLGAKKFAGRVFSVFVGPALRAGKDVPWILLELPHAQVESAKDFGQVVKEIQALCADSAKSHSHA